MKKRQSNYGIFFFLSFSSQTCLFACLFLIISKLTEVVVANITSSNNGYYSSYPVMFLSSPAPSVPQIKYDVFISFRGDDIRKGLLSHVLDSLSRKQIVAFSDNKVERGDGISEALFGAIERSLISLVMFSPDFAYSHWCLDELVKIVECRGKDGQILLPVFYQVDPTVVRHQKGSYGNALKEHLKNYSSTRVQTWKSALGESANISGIVSSNFPDDAKLVEAIVKCVSTKLKHVHQVNSRGLVGIEKPISHVESLLHLESGDVRVVGIWGIGGIGKTTIAGEVYNRLCSEFESCCFMANVREESERHGINSLKRELFSTLLEEQDLQIDTINGLPHFVERRIRRLKVLIVLDDVNDSQHLEILVGTLDWFGSGSRIIITTRDKQVLAGKVNDNDIHEVSALDSDESFRLFNLNALKENHLAMEYYELSKKMVDYAKGVPLVLKVLGHLLHGKGKDIWKSQSMMLKKVQIKEFHNIIRLSYNDLHHNEKRILLDIACFFDGLNLKVNYIKRLLKDREYSVTMGLERLKDKALITISQENIVSMHDLIQEMAWEIVREESIEDPGRRSRLLDPDDIYQVLKYNKGSEAIRSMAVNLTIIKQLQLSPKVFAKMSNLQFLDIYAKGSHSHSFLQDEGGLYLPQGLESLPNELRYLRWAYYPLESLPSNFSAEKLIVLKLPHSRVKKLWHEVQDLVNLNVLVLCSSTKLMELPDFSKATNLRIIDLRHCVGLTSVHPSVVSLNKLEKLDLSGCISLTSLRSNTHLSSLRYLSLCGCTALQEFSVTSENMIQLNLENTGIKQLPSSIGLQSKLEKLHLGYTNIDNLPESIKYLTRLRHLDLQHCKELQTLPELPSSLETLNARSCESLETVMFPSTAIEQLKENKRRVDFWNCLKLDEHSLRGIELNTQINMMKLAHQHVSTGGNGHDYDAQDMYVYPGSKVPKWLEYSTTHYYLTIDLSSAPYFPQLGFIFCFIIPAISSEGLILKFKISDIDEGQSIKVYLDRPRQGIESDHVYLMYHQGCSHFLSSRANNQPEIKIKVTAASRTLTSSYVPVQLRGFGVSLVTPSKYHQFIQQIELGDSSIFPTMCSVEDAFQNSGNSKC